MRLNNFRRVSAVAGLALVPALAFGAVAQAAPAPTFSESASAPVSHSQHKAGDEVAVKGTITEIGHIETPEGSVVGFKFGDSQWWLADQDTIVLKDGDMVDPHELEEGDDVWGEGTAGQEFVTAKHVTVH